jgi:threonine dehydratase
LINLEKIKQAHKAISPYINRTPLVLSNYLSKNRIVKLKLESLQITNSFKLRGATNKLLSLDNEQKQKGVIAVSTGNHGKGVAYACKCSWYSINNLYVVNGSSISQGSN